MARTKTKVFQTETKQLLKLMIHSLYSNKEIFIRELVSNASDALDKLRFNALADDSLLEDKSDLGIEVKVYPSENKIIISDNGIGMSEEEVVENIGTIARSGTASFLGNLTGDKKKDSNLIGQFGVGFYSVFMVADKVEVLTRPAKNSSEEATLWTSSGEESYQLKSAEKPSRGTDIIIYLNDENKEFADKSRVKYLLEKYSQYINFPLNINEDGGEGERINESEALWLKSKSNITDAEYSEFYKFISYDQNDPLLWVHNKVEGNNEYTNLLYIPKNPPFDLWNREAPRGVKLYIQRVFIMDDATNFLPLYLRFVRGIIDTSDLPLNVSREILQEHQLVDTIKKSVTKKVLDALTKMKNKSLDSYKEFWKEYGLVIKEGPAEDFENKELLASLMLFASSINDENDVSQTLDDYVSRMPEDQEKIYYCVADTFEAAINSPHIEGHKSNNTEVLMLTDRIDEWLMSNLMEFKGKELVNVAKDDIAESEKPKVSEADQGIVEKIKKHLSDRVSDVVVSSRLVNSATCLLLPKNEPGAQLRKILEAAGQDLGESNPIFEINLKHKLLKRLSSLKGKQFTSFVDFLYDYAVIAEGGSPKDPAKYLRQLDKYLS
ncbi:molecular chaperone HtpG [Gammaproteobacteria bacterium]|nr:molecular chaperone HtpG [Gammaproteobacteria bacterium]MDB9861450.1 molecular chaperone HtpG [Gammaproteobacteria bacterium]MDB9997302.1 molecular chaperone HtpG [Gammaproteobacteria bacterium]MDC1491470.1 molecular chaperone HtpG [Gammaproteobacteria bacterium]